MALTSVIERELARDPAFVAALRDATEIFLYVPALGPTNPYRLQIYLNKGTTIEDVAPPTGFNFEFPVLETKSPDEEAPLAFTGQAKIDEHLRNVEALILETRLPQTVKIYGGYAKQNLGNLRDKTPFYGRPSS